jgi:hypothetical protein
MADIKYDYVYANRPINDNIMRQSWIYDGTDDMQYTAFTGKNLNLSAKNLFTNMVYTNKVLQIVKSITGLFEGTYQYYKPRRICSENPICPHRLDTDYDPNNYCPYMSGESVVSDSVFFISLIDYNNDALINKNSWYEFNINLDYITRETVNSSQILIDDSITNNRYKIIAKSGVIELEKISGDNSLLVSDYEQENTSVISEIDSVSECPDIEDRDALIEAYKIEMEDLKIRYNDTLEELATKYEDAFETITTTDYDSVNV